MHHPHLRLPPLLTLDVSLNKSGILEGDSCGMDSRKIEGLLTVKTRDTPRPRSNRTAGEDSHGPFFHFSEAGGVVASIPEILLQTDFDGALAVGYVRTISIILPDNLEYHVDH